LHSTQGDQMIVLRVGFTALTPPPLPQTRGVTAGRVELVLVANPSPAGAGRNGRAARDVA
ncbi:hypothetical protein, partial [uncultured Chloroflexus sp.]|uniref:hypothetical protein n=1 Tax=uncultured Chloroflexus sp. TaxID=214040 RepID=UPI002636CDCA